MITERAYYSASIEDFLLAAPDTILGELTRRSGHSVEASQLGAWQKQVEILKVALPEWIHRGHLFFEFSVPRLGRRIDVLAIIDHVMFILEFKVGETHFTRYALDQVWDYALDLKNFHETSHQVEIAPILIATEAQPEFSTIASSAHNDGIFLPIKASPSLLKDGFRDVLRIAEGKRIDIQEWASGRYKPTPTIIEAASTLYGQHSVEDLSRSDGGAKNLALTSTAISALIARARSARGKAICFVTGVPGAGKTLVGLDIAARAGFDPRAALSLWRKMQEANKGAPPQWLSTHPSGNARMEEISMVLPRVLPLYAKAIGRSVEDLPQPR